MQLTFDFARVAHPNKTRGTRTATKRLTVTPIQKTHARIRNQPATKHVAAVALPTAALPLVSVAEALHRGSKVVFPKHANAVRVTIGGKTTVILKADADTLKGVGIATRVEFGIVKNDAHGHPIRKLFVGVR